MAGTRIIRIYDTWSLFKIAAKALVISSTLNGSYSKSSLVLQTIWGAGKEFKNDFEQDILRPAKSGEVRFFSSYDLNEKFDTIMVFFPGEMKESDLQKFFRKLLNTMTSKLIESVSLPLVGINMGGISGKNWAKQFNIALNEFYEEKQSFYPIREINLIFSYYDRPMFELQDIFDMIDEDFLLRSENERFYTAKFIGRRM